MSATVSDILSSTFSYLVTHDTILSTITFSASLRLLAIEVFVFAVPIFSWVSSIYSWISCSFSLSLSDCSSSFIFLSILVIDESITFQT